MFTLLISVLPCSCPFFLTAPQESEGEKVAFYINYSMGRESLPWHSVCCPNSGIGKNKQKTQKTTHGGGSVFSTLER